MHNLLDNESESGDASRAAPASGSEPTRRPQSESSPLPERNGLIAWPNGVWGAPDVAGTPAFDYSDGEQVERYLRATLDSAVDLSSVSPELERAITDWPTEYHLSPLRGMLLRALALDSLATVLELGAGCGAISRVLGERIGRVDAVEGSVARADLARRRCADLPGVEVICANYNTLQLPERRYDGVFLIGVLEYARRFRASQSSHRDTVKQILAELRECLAPGGVIVIAIENRTGLKYLFGSGEDHYALPYIGVYDYPDDDAIRTYTQPEWHALIEESGYRGVEFLYPFPDYKVPTVVLADRFVRQAGASLHLTKVRSRDYTDRGQAVPDEGLRWRGIDEAGAIGQLANSFLIVIGDDPATVDRLVDKDFLHGPNLVRRRQYRALTVKSRDALQVRKTPLYEAGEPVHSAVRHTFTCEPYRSGQSLSEGWLACIRIHNDLDRFAALVRRYYRHLNDIRPHYASTGKMVDLLPQNLLMAANGDLHAVDHEWDSTRDIDIEFVLFRALFYFTVDHRHALIGFCQLHRLATPLAFIERLFRACRVDLHSRLEKFIGWESEFQDAIVAPRHRRSLTAELHKTIDSLPFTARAYWQCGANAYGRDRSIAVEGSSGSDRQVLCLRVPEGVCNIDRLAINPTSMSGFFRLFGITVRAIDRNVQHRTVLRLDGAAQIANETILTDIECVQDEDRWVFVAGSLNGRLELALPVRDEQERLTAYIVEIDMDWPQSPDLRLVGRRFVDVKRELKQELAARRELEAMLRVRADQLERHADRLQRDLQRSHAEMQTLRGSRVWRLAEAVRRVVYRRPSLPPALPAPVAATEATPKPAPAKLTRDEQYRQLQRRQHIDAGQRAAMQAALRDWPYKPRISVVMPVYDTPCEWLEQALHSVQQQIYENWELCVVDDASRAASTRRLLQEINNPRITLRRLGVNAGIGGATAEGIAMASGDYVVFLDHDDVLAPDALYEVADAIRRYHADMIYSDEDFIDPDGQFVGPHFKPDFSPERLLAHNYVTHLVAIRRALLVELGGVRCGYDGAQDYDLVLRVAERSRVIHHIPKVLYHWRRSERSTSARADAKPLASANARRAVADALARRGETAEVLNGNMPHFFRVRRALVGAPKISIVIPFCDQPELLETCIGTLLGRTDYDRFEIIGVSNASESPPTALAMRDFETLDPRVRFVQFDDAFNFPRLVNFGVTQCIGEHIVLLNNDVQIISADWLQTMLEYSQLPDVGAVGGMLYYPDNTIQHAGIIVGIDGYAGHAHKHCPGGLNGYFNRLHIAHEVAAVTGAFLMVKRTAFDAVGGFDAEHFAIACNDVDFCLRLLKAGYRNIFTPHAKAYHIESASRGYEQTPAKIARFDREKQYFAERHGEFLRNGDPYYNPNLSLTAEDFSLRYESAAT